MDVVIIQVFHPLPAASLSDDVAWHHARRLRGKGTTQGVGAERGDPSVGAGSVERRPNIPVRPAAPPRIAPDRPRLRQTDLYGPPSACGRAVEGDDVSARTSAASRLTSASRGSALPFSWR